jgi:hypothetical protein
MNEADFPDSYRAELIDPKINEKQQAGWGDVEGSLLEENLK